MKAIAVTSIILIPFVIGTSVHWSSGGTDKPVPGVSFSSEYPEHIAGAFTGGFGEQSCHSCHFDYDLNQPEGELVLTGIQEVFKPGQEHVISIRVKREDMQRAGFQLTARFEDGSQAGHFELPENLTSTPGIDSDVTYVQHGVGLVEAEGGEKKWQVTWIAPDQVEAVIFNIAANAANGDASEFGDWIYVKEIQFQPDQ